MPITPSELRPFYARFLRGDRALLTGHSHQAWPDVAREGLVEAFDAAAELVDGKWGAAMEVADELRASIATRIGARPAEIALGQNTHELVTRFLSALDLRRRPHIVTTGGEFHSLRRQLARMAEDGLEVTWVDPAPLDTLAARLGGAIRDDTAALMTSSVLFETSSVVPHLELAVRAAHAHGAEVLLDAYHAFGVVPFCVGDFDEPVFVTAGGYKYAQWGEGCCFLRVPPDTTLRPVFTGWFADFESLERPTGGPVGYGRTPADRFAGSTYDPASHYRARAVSRFFDAQQLTVERLRALSLRQTGRILDGLDGYRVVTPRAPDLRGGFVSLHVDEAVRVVAELRERGVYADARGSLLRLGPAPYVTDDDIDRALETLRRLAPPG